MSGDKTVQYACAKHNVKWLTLKCVEKDVRRWGKLADHSAIFYSMGANSDVAYDKLRHRMDPEGVTMFQMMPDEWLNFVESHFDVSLDGNSFYNKLLSYVFSKVATGKVVLATLNRKSTYGGGTGIFQMPKPPASENLWRTIELPVLQRNKHITGIYNSLESEDFKELYLDWTPAHGSSELLPETTFDPNAHEAKRLKKPRGSQRRHGNATDANDSGQTLVQSLLDKMQGLCEETQCSGESVVMKHVKTVAGGRERVIQPTMHFEDAKLCVCAP